ncbi:MAG: RNHCP domain-containing protein [Candidatus Pacebacteria bacterium]|nr:RNHCP domain-containing protein [Candidatus Paceibacterota bacterium]
MDKLFQRKIEDFKCQNCGAEVKGDGYTNHCPNCLWSKHVDINPGDRASNCKRLMEPIEIEKKADEIIITHKCLECGHIKKNKSTPNDNYDKILEIIN